MKAIGTVFLTGASGYIGGSIAERLVQSGVRVRGLVRSPDKAAGLTRQGIEPVLGDLDDQNILRHEASQADAVINAASADHAESIKALIEGLAGRSKALIHTSGSSIIGDDVRGSRSSDVIYDEYTPLVVHELKQARRDIDLMVLAAAEQGVRSVVICPSLIYGQGKGLHPNSVQIPFLAQNAREQGMVQLVGAGLNRWSNVHISDVVELYLLAMENAPAGAFYFAASGESSFAEIGAALAERLGLGQVQSLDPQLAAERWGVAKAYFSLGSNSRVRSVRAKQELGWTPQHASLIDWILKELPK